MCNLYSVTSNQEAIRRLFGSVRDLMGNFATDAGRYRVPIIRNGPDGSRELARWGMSSPFDAVKATSPSSHT